MAELSKSPKDNDQRSFTLDENLEVARRVTGAVRPKGLNTAGRITEVTLNSSSWTALPSTPLTDRNAIAVQNESGINIKLNYDNNVVGYVGMTAPTATVGKAKIYIDSADGDLKIIFGDGTIKTIATDT